MNVALHTPETIYSPRHVPSWLLLCGAAGMVNGFAFLTCQQFVTHVTGTVTRLGLEWSQATIVLECAAILFAFLIGAIVATVSIRLRAHLSSRTRWATPLFAVAGILFVVGVGGGNRLFGILGGSAASDPPPVVLLTVLAFAMGLQNAAVAATTGLAIRTTHLSGPVTDLGIHLGTVLLTTKRERTEALRGAALRGGKVAAFFAGGALSIAFTPIMGYYTLLLAAGFVFIAAILSFLPNWSPSDQPFSREHERLAPAARSPSS